YWWTRALHMAPTAAVVPFNYLSLVWAVIFGFAIWGEVPTLGLLIGSAVVVGSGLFLLWRESRRAVVPETAAGLRGARGSAASIHLDAGRAHELAIDLELPAHMEVELRRRHRHRVGAEIVHLLARARVCQRLGDFAVQAHADLRRDFRRREHA